MAFIAGVTMLVDELTRLVRACARLVAALVLLVGLTVLLVAAARSDATAIGAIRALMGAMT